MATINEELIRLKSELDLLSSMTQEIGKSKDASLAAIQAAEQHTESVQQAINAFNTFFKQIETRTDQLFKSLGDETDESISLIVESKHELVVCSEELRGVLEGIEELEHKVYEHTKTIENVNFPERLEKLDQAISGISMLIQSVLDVTEETQKLFVVTKDGIQKQVRSLEQNVDSRLSTFDAASKERLLESEKGRRSLFTLSLVIVVLIVLLYILQLVIHFSKN